MGIIQSKTTIDYQWKKYRMISYHQIISQYLSQLGRLQFCYNMTLHMNPKSMRTLKEQIDDQVFEFMDMAPTKVVEVLVDQIKELAATDITDAALKKGDKAPKFVLPNASNGKMISSTHMLKKGPLVVSFFRGEWCPYCNTTLKMFQAYADDIKAAGGTLVAISPQTLETATTFAQSFGPKFIMLSDENNGVAKKFNITFEMGGVLIPVLEDLGIYVERYNGKESPYMLPLPATYIINTDGTIYYSFVECDYKKRAEPTEILKVLSTIPKSKKKSRSRFSWFAKERIMA